MDPGLPRSDALELRHVRRRWIPGRNHRYGRLGLSGYFKSTMPSSCTNVASPHRDKEENFLRPLLRSRWTRRGVRRPWPSRAATAHPTAKPRPHIQLSETTTTKFGIKRGSESHACSAASASSHH
eukprot:1107261-Rhodomonas_salina.1